MREKYESLSASVLRELAKSRGIKGTSTMKKAQLVEAMLALDESEAESKKAEEAAKPKTAAKAESEKTEKTERTTSVHHSRGSARRSTCTGRTERLRRYLRDHAGRLWIYPQ